MKKVLLTTTVLAFAGSAFAADVSGWARFGYQSDKEGGKTTKSQAQWMQTTMSGSKTASNGLTFGGSYTLRTGGGAGDTGSYTAGKNEGGASSLTSTNVKHGKYTAGNISTLASVFVSGSFGKVTMGHQDVASRSHGSATAMAGSTVGGFTDIFPEDRKEESKAVGYTSPSFNGVAFAYTTEFKKNPFSSYAVNWSGAMSGVNLKVAYGSYKAGKAGAKASTSYGAKVSKGAFSASYTSGKKEGGTTDANKYTTYGVDYSAGKIGVGYQQSKTKAAGSKTTKLMHASYSVASGLTAFIENKDTGSKKTTVIGTTISF